MRTLRAFLLLAILAPGCGGGEPPAAPPPSDPFASKPRTVAPPPPNTLPESVTPAVQLPKPPATEGIIPDEDKRAFPPQVAYNLRQNFLSIPQYYQEQLLTPEQRQRLQRLLEAGKGTEFDEAWLEAIDRMPALKSARIDYDAILLDCQSWEWASDHRLFPVDRLILKDGSVIDGRVLEEDPVRVRMERIHQSAVAGMLELLRKDIREIRKGVGIGTEFARFWEAANTLGPDKMIDLMRWAKSKGLDDQRILASWRVLKVDPGNEEARGEVQLRRFRAPPDAALSVLEEPKRGSKGRIFYRGREWDPAALRDQLLKEGFAILDGQWYAPVERMISAPGLAKFDTTKQTVSIVPEENMHLYHDCLVDLEPVYDAVKQAWAGKFRKTIQRRFYTPGIRHETSYLGSSSTIEMVSLNYKDELSGGDAAQRAPGRLRISVPFDAPLLEASVRVLAVVKSGAAVGCLELQGRRIEAFRVQSGMKSYELPKEVKGQRELRIILECTQMAKITRRTIKRVTAPVNKDPRSGQILAKGSQVVYDSAAVECGVEIFPSNSNTSEVFRARVAVGQLSVPLNRLFEEAKATDVLQGQ